MENTSNSRGMVTLKCWGSEINSFLLSSSKPTPVGPARTQRGRKRCQKMMEGIYGSSSGVNPALASTQLGRGRSTRAQLCFSRRPSFRKLESYIRKKYFLLSFTDNPARFYKTQLGVVSDEPPFFFFFKVRHQ